MRFIAVTLLALVAAVMASPDGVEKRQQGRPKVQEAVGTDSNGNIVGFGAGGVQQQSVTDAELQELDEAEISELQGDIVDNAVAAAEADGDAGAGAGAGAGAAFQNGGAGGLGN